MEPGGGTHRWEMHAAHREAVASRAARRQASRPLNPLEPELRPLEADRRSTTTVGDSETLEREKEREEREMDSERGVGYHSSHEDKRGDRDRDATRSGNSTRCAGRKCFWHLGT